MSLRIYKQELEPNVLAPFESEDLRLATKAMSCVRVVDSNMLSRVMRQTYPQTFGRWKIEDFGELMLKLRKTEILVWEKGVAIDSGIRHGMSEYLKDHEPKIFKSAHTAALSVYRDWLSRPVDNRSMWIGEEFFHMASLDPKVDLKRTLKNRLAEYPKWIKDDDQRQNAVIRLAEDLGKDHELKALSKFVPGMLGFLEIYIGLGLM